MADWEDIERNPDLHQTCKCRIPRNPRNYLLRNTLDELQCDNCDATYCLHSIVPSWWQTTQAFISYI